MSTELPDTARDGARWALLRLLAQMRADILSNPDALNHLAVDDQPLRTLVEGVLDELDPPADDAPWLRLDMDQDVGRFRDHPTIVLQASPPSGAVAGGAGPIAVTRDLPAYALADDALLTPARADALLRSRRMVAVRALLDASRRDALAFLGRYRDGDPDYRAVVSEHLALLDEAQREVESAERGCGQPEGECTDPCHAGLLAPRGEGA